MNENGRASICPSLRLHRPPMAVWLSHRQQQRRPVSLLLSTLRTGYIELRTRCGCRAAGAGAQQQMRAALTLTADGGGSSQICSTAGAARGPLHDQLTFNASRLPRTVDTLCYYYPPRSTSASRSQCISINQSIKVFIVA